MIPDRKQDKEIINGNEYIRERKYIYIILETSPNSPYIYIYTHKADDDGGGLLSGCAAAATTRRLI